MIKNVLIENIIHLFGPSKGGRFRTWVERWVDEQLKRGVTTEDDWVFLEQLGLERLYANFKRVFEEVEPSNADIFEHVIVVPARDLSSGTLVPMIEFKYAFFEAYLEQCGVKVVSRGVIRSDDIISQHGTFEHIYVDQDSDATGDISAYYINLVGRNEMEGSLIMSADEINHIKAGQVSYKYGGIEPLNSQEWDDFVSACLCRRLIATPTFDSLRNDCSEGFNRLFYAVQHHNELYSKGMRAGNQKAATQSDGWVKFTTKRIFADISQSTTHANSDACDLEDKNQTSDNVVCMASKRAEISEAQSTKPVYAEDVKGNGEFEAQYASSEASLIDSGSSEDTLAFEPLESTPLVNSDISIF